jgi:hypothetical protein
VYPSRRRTTPLNTATPSCGGTTDTLLNVRRHRTRIVISKDQVMPLLMEACPSYRLPEDDRDLLYVVLGDFARHLLQLQQQSRTEEFADVARAIERLHIEGDHNVREAATIGLLEGIQNVWGNNGTDPELFVQHLLPVSAKWWQSLNDFWSGRSKFVGEGL